MNLEEEFDCLEVGCNSDEKMDELVHDLTNALEESAKLQKTKSSESLSMYIGSKCRQPRKRRGQKRRGKKREKGNKSDESESSLEEVYRDYVENLCRASDSDDLTVTQRMPAVVDCKSNTHTNMICLAESDSVTETFSPMRANRRRRRFKRMAIDPGPSLTVPEFNNGSKGMREKPEPVCCGKELEMEEEYNELPSTSTNSENFAGKRKRTLRNNGGGSFDNDQENDCMMSPNSSSSLSSSESEPGILTFDEGRDGDDEQSDFFHENGPACGIPGIIPWWNKTNDEEVDPTFEKILTGTFDHMSTASQRSFKARLTTLMDTGRQMRAGRRKLKDRHPNYSMSRFLQDRQQWMEKMAPKLPNFTGIKNHPRKDTKRLRKTPPPSQIAGFVGENAEPISDDNIGNQMLQSMGWEPGTGLGTDGAGIQTPVMAYMRHRKQGLGYDNSS